MTITGTGRLLRFYLRRDRLMLVWWVLGSALLYWSQGASVDSLYPTQAEFDKAAANMANNVAFVAMAGPPRALNTVGGQVAWQATAFGAIVAGLMSMFLVGRHTRSEEETGRDELIRAAAVERHAPLAATVVLLVVADALLGGGVAASLIAYDLPVAGSLNIGLGAMLAGLVFGAVALVAAQLTESTRTVYGITGAVLIVSYVLRAIGDIGNGVLSWLSPIGWAQAMHSFSGDRWWPALVSVTAVIVLLAVTARLFARRDFGAGVWAGRPGPARAGDGLQGAFGLAWRLQRGTVVGWGVGLLLTGLAYGAIGDDVGDLIGDSQYSQDVFGQGGGSIVESFYAVAALMLALIAAGFAISSALRPRGEEDAGRTEALLSAPLPRWRWALSHLTVTVVGSVAVVGAAGLGMGLGYAMVTGDGSAVGRLFGATVPYAVPVLVLVAFTWLLYGLAPRLASIGWLLLAFCAVVLLFGESLQLPQWLMGLSPFGQLALAPAEPFAWAPVLLQVALSTVVAAAGFAALSYRDLR